MPMQTQHRKPTDDAASVTNSTWPWDHSEDSPVLLLTANCVSVTVGVQVDDSEMDEVSEATEELPLGVAVELEKDEGLGVDVD